MSHLNMSWVEPELSWAELVVSSQESEASWAEPEPLARNQSASAGAKCLWVIVKCPQSMSSARHLWSSAPQSWSSAISQCAIVSQSWSSVLSQCQSVSQSRSSAPQSMSSHVGNLKSVVKRPKSADKCPSVNVKCCWSRSNAPSMQFPCHCMAWQGDLRTCHRRQGGPSSPELGYAARGLRMNSRQHLQA